MGLLPFGSLCQLWLSVKLLLRWTRVEFDMYLCYRCLTLQTKDEMITPSKIKGLCKESSRLLKQCKNKKCKCRTFWEV